MDPKLNGGMFRSEFSLAGPPGTSVNAQAILHDGSSPLGTIWAGTLSVGSAPVNVSWNGRDGSNDYVDTGSYKVILSASGAASAITPLHVVRLGITHIDAQASAQGNDTWQMIYFKQGSAYKFNATPEKHEYQNIARKGDISDLDFDNGNPRDVVPVHLATDQPVLFQGALDTSRHNYPLAYQLGASPNLNLWFGKTSTTANGTQQDAGYPIQGYELRCYFNASYTAAIQPGTGFIVTRPALPQEVIRTFTSNPVYYQWRKTGTGAWNPIFGSEVLDLSYYTTLGAPVGISNDSGIQYTGPWVEISDHFNTWRNALQIQAVDVASLTDLAVRGMVGPLNGTNTIEGIRYDNVDFPFAEPGYWSGSAEQAQGKFFLSGLLDGASNGPDVTCDDCAPMLGWSLAMLGAPNMEVVFMRNVGTPPSLVDLRSVYGIGGSTYTDTMNQFFNAPQHGVVKHTFLYHKALTDDHGSSISDICVQVDGDSNPDLAPGFPGWNARRLFSGANGYDELLCTSPLDFLTYTQLPLLR